jgi:hypothetical protein
MMLADLGRLFSCVDDPDAQKSAYIRAIVEANCLAKRSDKTRKLTANHLVALYGLDPQITLFRGLRFFWERDPEGRPLLALFCALARDSVLGSSVPFIERFSPGQVVTRQALEKFLDDLEPGRFSPATLKSTAQNINGTWTQSGHLRGKAKKTRSQPTATPGAVAYALLLGYLTGGRGQALYQTFYAGLLDCPLEQAIELSVEAARRGWLVVKRLDTVIEVLFPNVLSEQELEWTREQG